MDINFFLTQVIAIIVGITIVYYTRKLYQKKIEHAEIDKEISLIKLEHLKKESQLKEKVLQEVNLITNQISSDISSQLIADQKWLDKFLDETGVSYSGSIFGGRVRHFYYEKRILAKYAIERINSYLIDSDKKICLLIDSGTSMYPVFYEIVDCLKRSDINKLWKENIYIITNNLPGIQFLMKHCKEYPNDLSGLGINSFLLPGKPLPAYAAITGKETEVWLDKIDTFLETVWKCDTSEYKIVSFITGNYFVPKVRGAREYLPVARGEGHVEIKTKMVEKSNEIFLLAPLMKFSFAEVELLNHVNKFDVDRKEIERAKKDPRKVKYESIQIPKEKCFYFTTKRKEQDSFYYFSKHLSSDLKFTYKDNATIIDFDLKKWNPSISEKGDYDIEIPHEELSRSYWDGNDIWNEEWVHNQPYFTIKCEPVNSADRE